jgi:hypothetical protein
LLALSGRERKGGMNVATESSQEFGEFVRGRRETLRKLAFWMCGDWHASEDVVQDALVAIHRHWPGLDNAGRISYAEPSSRTLSFARWAGAASSRRIRGMRRQELARRSSGSID